MDLANLVIRVATQGVSEAKRDLANLRTEGASAEGSFKGLTNVTGLMTKAMGLLGLAVAGVKLADLIRDSAMLAARYETMGVVMRVAANNAGYYNKEAQALEKQLRSQGISALQARNAIVQLATANLDLKKATDLGRAAQDLAVVAGINSSEAYERMIRGIKSGEVEILRTLGLNVNFENAYKSLARQLGTTTDKLTENQKVQARMDAVLKSSTAYTGIYEEAMGTAGKQITSLTRYWEDLRVEMGKAFLPMLTDLVAGLTDGLKATNEIVQEIASSEIAQALGVVLAGAFKVLTIIVQELLYSAGQLVRTLGMILTVGGKIMTLDFSGAQASFESWLVSIEKAQKADSALLDKRIAGLMKTGQKVAEVSKAEEDKRIAAGRAIRDAAAAEEKAARARDEEAKAAKKAASAASQRAAAAKREYEQLVARSEDYIKSLREEIEEIGRTDAELRKLQITRAMADAPLAKQKAVIQALGEERERALAAAAAWDYLGNLRAQNADRTMTPLQQLQRDNRVVLNDSAGLDGGLTSVRTEQLKLAAEFAERWAEAQRMVDVEIIRTAADLDSVTEGMKDYWTVVKQLERMNDLLDEAAFNFNTLYSGIKNKDWAAAAQGLVGLFGKEGTFAKTYQQYGGGLSGGIGVAATGAQMVGSMIGGRTGNAIMGAASGAMVGLQFGGPVGAAVGAVIGGALSIIGGNAQKRRERREREQQEAEQKAQKAQQIAQQRQQLEVRLLELQGKSLEAVTKARAAELNAMDASLRDLAKEVYAAEDAEELRVTRLQAEVRLLELSGKSIQAVNLQRQEELRNMKDYLRPLAQAMWAAEDAAAALTKAEDNLKSILSERTNLARTNLTNAYNREAGALTSVIEKFRDFGKTLRQFRADLETGEDALNSPEDQYAKTRQQLTELARRAKLGDADAMGQFTNASQAFLSASRGYNASSSAYFSDLDWVKQLTDDLTGVSDRAADNAERQLQILKDQVEAALGVKEAVLTVDQALDEFLKASQEEAYWTAQIDATHGVTSAVQSLEGAIGALASAQAANAAAQQALAEAIKNTPTQAPAQDYTSTSGYTSTNGDYAAYVAQNPDLAALYASGGGMTSGRTQAEFGLYHWANYGSSENRPVRPFAKGGIVSNPTFLPLAGEAGPEAIIPLRRNSRGELGVQAGNDNGDLAAAIRDLAKELRAANQLGVASAQATIERLDNLIDGAAKQERAARAAGAR